MMMKELFKTAGRTLLDVRNAEELIVDGKADEAVHIPMNLVPERLEEIKNLDKPLLIFCKSGGRSGQVVEFLKNNGFENVYNVGGFTDVEPYL